MEMTQDPGPQQQDPPFSIQIEPTEGCNLRCAFCGIAGIRAAGTREALSGPYKHMRADTARIIGQQITEAGWRPRLELAMHGEPTLNPDLADLVAILRLNAPDCPIMLTTNGIPLLPRWDTATRELFDAGLTTMAVDDYKPYKARNAVLGTRIPGITVHRYPQDGPVASPHRRPRRGERRMVLVQDIGEAVSGNHSHLSNHAGAAAPLDLTPRGTHGRCTLPFREMSVRWDGNVALCCNDWRGAFKLGNVHTTPMPDMWQAPAMAAVRRRLYAGRRDTAPCAGCTHRSTRVGLLPDKLGKKTLPPPQPGDDELMAAALAGDPYTPTVRRKWEQEETRP